MKVLIQYASAVKGASIRLRIIRDDSENRYAVIIMFNINNCVTTSGILCAVLTTTPQKEYNRARKDSEQGS